MHDILHHCHTSYYGRKFERQTTTIMVLQLGFFSLTLFKDVHTFACIVIDAKDMIIFLGDKKCLCRNYGSRVVWCLYNRFYETICALKSQSVHIDSSGLCFIKNENINFSKWCQSGNQNFEKGHLYKVWNTKGKN